MRVLIVEDDPTNQMLASLWFKKAGVASSDITTVNNGQEAVELIIKNAKLSPAQLFDIIYMDNEMPQMGGEEATQKIRAVEKEQNLPAADIRTCSGTYEGVFPGANGRLNKPFVPKEFIALVQEKRAQQDSHRPQSPKPGFFTEPKPPEVKEEPPKGQSTPRHGS